MEQLESRRLLATFVVSEVSDGGTGSLRQAIIDANSNPGVDAIVFGAATNGADLLLTLNQFQITESLTITGNGADNTVIDAQLNSRIFEIAFSAVNVTISGVTLKNGRVAGPGSQQGGAIQSLASGTLSISSSVLSGNTVDDTAGTGAYGGAVFVQGGSLRVFGSTISGNTADWGGAIYAAGDSDVSITSSNVDGNFASNDGGAIYAGFSGQGDVTITGSTLENNTSQVRGGAIRADNVTITGGSSVRLNTATTEGGAIHADGNVSVTNSTISENTSSTEGGAIHAGGNVTVTSGSTINDNTANGNGGAIFSVGSTEVTNSTLANNFTTGDNHRGGAIHSNSGGVTVSQSTLSGNSTAGMYAYGGAIFAGSGAVTISQSTLSGNSTAGMYAGGGAIFATSGAVTISQSTLSGNSTAELLGVGGAIRTGSGAVTISQSTLSGNSTAGRYGRGGAISAGSGVVTISQSTLSGNSTAGYTAPGGAIYARSGAVTISESTLSGNSTAGRYGSGGAISAGSGTVTISQSTLSGNSAEGSDAFGGAIYADSNAVTISQSTLTLNNVAQGQGGAIFSNSSPVTILNSIVAGNSDDGTAPDVRKSPNSDDAFTVTNSLIGRNNGTGLTATVGTTPGANGNLIGGDNAGAAINPQLGPLANNGGPTQTHALLSTSPAIDRGSNALAVDAANGNSPLTTDQRGNPFPRIASTTVDMGAYEFFTGPLVVSTNVDESDGNFSSGDLSLREAISLANSIPETNSIAFATSTNGTEFDLSLNEMLVTDTLTITGNGAANTIIDAQQLSRIFNFSAGNFTLSGVTLKNGLALEDDFNGGGAIVSSSSGLLSVQNSILSGNSTGGFGSDGGAISASTGAVTVFQSTFSGNFTTGSYASGGAIYMQSGALTISRSTLFGNRTNGFRALGGATYSKSGAVSVSQSTLSGNSTAGNFSLGGAISTRYSELTVSQSTLSGNSTTGPGSAGGAIFAGSGSVSVSQSTLTLNASAQGEGGAIFGLSSPVTITNSIIAGNTDNDTAPDVRKSGEGDAFTVTNSLIGRNNGTGLPATGSTPGANSNLIGGDTVETAINPQLAPLANNGGPTQTHALLVNSPAFNRGSNASASTFTTDQRGSGFPRTSFGIVDMGAVESTVLDSPEGTTRADAFVLTYSATTTAGTVTVTVSTGSGPVVNLGTFPMNSPLTINGLGGTDSVRVVGTSGADTFTANSSTALIVNGASLILTSIESRTLAGAAGSDVYKFDADGTLGLFTLDEAGGGTDTIDLSPTTTLAVTLNLGLATTQVVNANLSLILGSTTHFENAIGGSQADTLTGNTLANSLTGGPGNDSLNGLGGNDTLSGGLNNDTYIFSPATAAEADVVIEAANQGADTLSFAALTTSVKMHLGSLAVQPVHTNRTLKLNSQSTFENAIGGSGADTLTGNSLGNVLTGNAGNDTLIGGAGNDTLVGGVNDDTYIFGTATTAEVDVVTELANQGTDTLSFATLRTPVNLSLNSIAVQGVHTNRTLTLNSQSTFENAIGGLGADTLTGNSLNNVLTGGVGNDTLTGGPGSDTLVGGLQNDTYIFGTATAAEADVVIEAANQGIDVLSFAAITTNVNINLGSLAVQPVHTNRTLKLNSQVTFENVIGGSGADSLTGNTLNNSLTGNAGNDTLAGGAGDDTLFGGLNNDTYIFGAASSAESDFIVEVLNQGTDTLSFASLASDLTINLASSEAQPVHTNRTLRLNSGGSIENVLGGSGNDLILGNGLNNLLNGGNGNNILVGNNGNDTLLSGSGRDILIGGRGLDNLNGGSGEDILIAGRTTSDAITTNLLVMRTAWIAATPYATRITNLRAGVSVPAVSLKAKVNVLNDSGEDDVLTGGANLDWYFRAVDDAITDFFASEIIDLL